MLVPSLSAFRLSSLSAAPAFPPSLLAPSPACQEKSKIDLQIESGEFFLGKHARERAKKEERLERQKDKRDGKQKEKAQAFVPPQEDISEKMQKRKRMRHLSPEGSERQ